MRLVTYRATGGCAGVQTVDGVLDAGALLGERPLEPAAADRGGPPRRAGRAGEGGVGRRAGQRHSPAAARPGPRQDRLHRPQLPLPRGRGGHRPARAADLLRQVPQRPRARRRDRGAAGGEREGRLRGGGRLRRRAALQGGRPRPRPSTRSPATCCSTTSPPATSSSRRRSGCPARSSTARRPAARRSSPPTRRAPPDEISFALDLNGERMQEASTSDLIFSVAELVARLSRLDDARAGRHRLDRDAVRRRQRPRAAGLAQAWRRDRDQLADPGRAAHDDRLAARALRSSTSSSIRA